MDTSDGVCGKLLTLLSSLSSSMSVHATRGVSWGSFHVFLPCFKTYIEQCLLADDQVLSGIARNVDMGIVLRRKMKEGILFEFRHPFSGKVLKPLDLWDIWSFSRIFTLEPDPHHVKPLTKSAITERTECHVLDQSLAEKRARWWICYSNSIVLVK